MVLVGLRVVPRAACTRRTRRSCSRSASSLGGLWGPIFGHVAAELPDRQAPDAGAAPGRGGELRADPARTGPGAAGQRRRRRHQRLPRRMPAQRAADRRATQALHDAALAVGSAMTLGLCRVAVGHAGPPVARGRRARAPQPGADVRQRRGDARAGRRLRRQPGRGPAVGGVRRLRRHAVRLPRRPCPRRPHRLARRAHADGRARRARPSARTCATALARALGDPALELAFWMPELEPLRRRGRVAGRAARPRTTPAAR